MDEKQFYTYKDGTKTEMCKKCLTAHIDNFDESTFLWLLEKMDVPYVPQEWNVLRDRAYAKDPRKMNGMTVFGKYLSKMKLKQWRDFGWADNEKIRELNEERIQQALEDKERYETEIKEEYQEGKITEAQYKTLISTETQHAEESLFSSSTGVPADNALNENEFMSEDELPNPADELTKEDKLYLAIKWGRLYRPIEWIEMERKYNEMINSFDIEDSDTIGSLILICKTYLKLNQAIDIGDVDGYNKLARTYDALRKSAKFTAAQNKKEEENFVDTVGELVAYCERERGQIPEYDLKIPKDIIDEEIADLKSYTKSLIYKDPSISQQIENYLKHKQVIDNNKKAIEEAREQGLEMPYIQNDDYQDYFKQIAQEKEDDKLVYNEEVSEDGK